MYGARWSAVQVRTHWLNEGMEYCPPKPLPHPWILTPQSQGLGSLKILDYSKAPGMAPGPSVSLSSSWLLPIPPVSLHSQSALCWSNGDTLFPPSGRLRQLGPPHLAIHSPASSLPAPGRLLRSLFASSPASPPMRPGRRKLVSWPQRCRLRHPAGDSLQGP